MTRARGDNRQALGWGGGRFDRKACERERVRELWAVHRAKLARLRAIEAETGGLVGEILKGLEEEEHKGLES